jgi:hypothetical protein
VCFKYLNTIVQTPSEIEEMMIFGNWKSSLKRVYWRVVVFGFGFVWFACLEVGLTSSRALFSLVAPLFSILSHLFIANNIVIKHFIVISWSLP